MSDNSIYTLAVTTGFAALAGLYTAWSLRKGYKKLNNNGGLSTKDPNSKIKLPEIKIEDLAPLISHYDIKIRKAAEQVLVDHASTQSFIAFLLEQCGSNDVETILKSTVVVKHLSKSSSVCKMLMLQQGALSVLAKTIKNISNDCKFELLMERCKEDVRYQEILAAVMSSIFQLTHEEIFPVMSIARENDVVHYILFNILSDESYLISPDTKRKATHIVLQLFLLEMVTLRKNLIDWGIIRKVTKCFINTIGLDNTESGLCLQILLQFIGNMENHAESFLKEMALLGILPHLVGLLRTNAADDLTRRAAVLIHEYCVNDVEKITITNLPCIIKILYGILCNSQAAVQHTILRIFCYLSLGNKRFQRSLLQYAPLLKKLAVALSSGHQDVLHWSQVLIHDLAMGGKLIYFSFLL